MAARIHRIGTIYSRMDGLIRKGHIKETEKPLWFDVYKSFPPKYEPTYKRTAPDIKVREILYKEDILRAKIHKALNHQLGAIDLNSNTEIFSEKLLKSCQEYVSEGMSEDEALEKVKLSIADYQAKKESSQTETKTKPDIGKLLDEVF